MARTSSVNLSMIRELADLGFWESPTLSFLMIGLHQEWLELQRANPEGAAGFMANFAHALEDDKDRLQKRRTDQNSH